MATQPAPLPDATATRRGAVPATSGTTGQVLQFNSGGAIIAGSGGGITVEDLEAHAAVNHAQLDNGLTVLSGPGNVFSVLGGNVSVMQLFNNTGSPLSLTGTPPFDSADPNAALVTLINAGADAITFNGGAGFTVTGGTCTLQQWETVTFFLGGPYVGNVSEVSRSSPQVIVP